MIKDGGIVWRLVLDDERHPGDPSLADHGIPRTEYLLDDSSGELRWTISRDDALRFPTHLAAEAFAKKHSCHAAVAGADESTVPERQRPIEPPPPIPPTRTLRKTRPRKRRNRKTERKSWVIESYG